jgi:hypothetical protein
MYRISNLSKNLAIEKRSTSMSRSYHSPSAVGGVFDPVAFYQTEVNPYSYAKTFNCGMPHCRLSSGIGRRVADEV